MANGAQGRARDANGASVPADTGEHEQAEVSRDGGDAVYGEARSGERRVQADRGRAAEAGRQTAAGGGDLRRRADMARRDREVLVRGRECEGSRGGRRRWLEYLIPPSQPCRRSSAPAVDVCPSRAVGTPAACHVARRSASAAKGFTSRTNTPKNGRDSRTTISLMSRKR